MTVNGNRKCVYKGMQFVTKSYVAKTFHWELKSSGLVDKTTAQQPKVQQFETDRRQRLGLKKFSVKIPRPYNSTESSKIKIILSTRTSWSSG